MKLTRVALAALAVAAAPAFAQSNVTVYGALDAGLLNITNTSGGTGYLPSAVNNGTVTKLADGGIGGSNWGIKGSEDLGGGLKANFQLQGNVNVSNGNAGGPNSASGTSFFNQYTTVGLSGNWGKVDLGRQVSPMYYAFASTDARGGRYFGSSLTALVGLNSASGNFIGDNSNPSFGTVYNDNAIVYSSPNFGGVVVSAEFAPGNASGNANTQEALTAQYDSGNGLKLSALWYNGYGNNLADATAALTAKLGSASAAAAYLTAKGLTATTNTNNLTEIGALYTTGPFTVSAEYFQARNPSNVVVMPGGSASLNMWDIGAGYKIGTNMNLTAGYYKIIDNTNSGNYATQFALGLDYYLSKRTTLYVEAASTSNNGANMNLSPMYANPTAAGTSNTAYMLGLRHTF